MPAFPPEATTTPLSGMSLASSRFIMPRALKLPLTCMCSSLSHTSAPGTATPNAAAGSFHNGVSRRKWPARAPSLWEALSISERQPVV